MVQVIKKSNQLESFHCPNCWGHQEYACETNDRTKKFNLGWILNYVGNKLISK